MNLTRLAPVVFTMCSAASLSAADEVATDYWLRVMPAAWFASITGETSYTSNGIGGTSKNFADLGLDNTEANFALEAGAKLPIIFSFHVGAFQQESDGGFASGGFTYGGQAFTNGSSYFGVSDLYAEADIRAFDFDTVGVAAGIAWHVQHSELTLTGGGNSAALDEDYHFPALALRGHANLPVLLSLGAEAKIHWMEISINGTKVSYLDAMAQITYMPWDMLGFMAGYRLFSNNITFKQASGVNANGKIDLSLAGPFVGLIAKF